jgi:hypothetical protein
MELILSGLFVQHQFIDKLCVLQENFAAGIAGPHMGDRGSPTGQWMRVNRNRPGHLTTTP